MKQTFTAAEGIVISLISIDPVSQRGRNDYERDTEDYGIFPKVEEREVKRFVP